MNYKLLLLILFISIFSHSTNDIFLTDNEQSYFCNHNNIKIANKIFSPEALSIEIPTFYGIYRIGADLIQKTIENKTHNNKFVLGVIDDNFDTGKNFIKNKIQNSLPFCEIIEKRKDEMQEHGTHVVGTICGEEYGVAYNCNFSLCLALGNGCSFENDNCYDTYFKSILDYYLKNNVRIVSRSMGSKKILHSFDEEDTIKQIIKFTNTTNAIFVNAAGNDNVQIFDIDEDSLEQNNILVVSNIDFLNFKNESSNFGDLIFLAAPGTDIFSSTTKENEQNDKSIYYDNSKDDEENRLIKLTGTSMATPHVSGTIAAMIDVNPNLDNNAIKLILQKTALSRLDKKSKIYGYGVINAYGAVKIAKYLLNNEFDNAIDKLNAKSALYLEKALNIMRNSTELNEKELLLVEKLLRKSHLSDPNNIKSKHAFFLFQKNFGYSEEANCLAIDLFIKTKEQQFLDYLLLDTKYLLKKELGLLLQQDSFGHDLLQIVNDSIIKHEEDIKQIVQVILNGNFDSINEQNILKLTKINIETIIKNAIEKNNFKILELLLTIKTRYDYPNKSSQLSFISFVACAIETKNIEAQKLLLFVLKKYNSKNFSYCLNEVIKNALKQKNSLQILKELDDEELLDLEFCFLLTTQIKDYQLETLKFLLTKKLEPIFLSNLFVSAIKYNDENYINLFDNINLAINKNIILNLLQNNKSLLIKTCKNADVTILEKSYINAVNNKIIKLNNENINILFECILEKNPKFEKPKFEKPIVEDEKKENIDIFSDLYF